MYFKAQSLPGNIQLIVIFLVSLTWQDLPGESPASPGQSRYDDKRYIEYIVGDMPLIITAPHGGRLVPSSIPDRSEGVLLADGNTDLLARDIADAFRNQTGKVPHVIICHLKRIKLDCNREIGEAAQGNGEAEQAWNDFHGFIEEAREEVLRQYGKGLYIDLHGHGHPVARLELGYLLGNRQLKSSARELEALKDRSSIRQLVKDSRIPFPDLLRGDSSFGAMMQKRGYPSVPSPEFPHAGEEKYFSGGYNTRRYGSLEGGEISGFQVECPRRTVRDTDKNRKAFAKAFVEAMEEYLKLLEKNED